MRKYILLIFIISLFGLSCSKFLEPEPENKIDREVLLGIPAYAEGLLLKAYNAMPTNTNFQPDVASGDAVTNALNSDYRLMATGGWTSTDDPLSIWGQAYTQMYYINTFMDLKNDVVWDAENQTMNDLHLKRLTGEAYGLRAWWGFQLLKNHAGISTSGKLLGYPIILKAVTVDGELNLPRNTFEECVEQIISDCDSALFLLPDTYKDETDNAVYNAAMGQRWKNRLDGNSARALKSWVLLLAASPAYNLSNDDQKWKDAAQAAGTLIKLNGGVPSLSSTGLKWYTNFNDPEIIWSRAIVTNRGLESSNFPPSLLGNGNLNPSQELVNDFPMQNGYPIEYASSGYDADAPYSNRDPRLSEYVLYNGNALGAKGEIFTYIDASLDGINKQTNSTRTGYYVKKFMLDNVNISDPAVNQPHFKTYFRYTEIFLNYAEAANEAYGPDADPHGMGFTPRTILAAIRKRGGITQPDNYLASLSSKEDFRKLIHTERRIELCFENIRIYDVRRWKDLSHFKKSITGVFIEKVGNDYTYRYENVESRLYEDYMIYGPIPKGQIRISNRLEQNQEWE